MVFLFIFTFFFLEKGLDIMSSFQLRISAGTCCDVAFNSSTLFIFDLESLADFENKLTYLMLNLVATAKNVEELYAKIDEALQTIGTWMSLKRRKPWSGGSVTSLQLTLMVAKFYPEKPSVTESNLRQKPVLWKTPGEHVAEGDHSGNFSGPTYAKQPRGKY